MLKWVHYCPLRDRAITSSDAKTIESPDEAIGKIKKDEKDEKNEKNEKKGNRRKDGTARGTRGSKTATPDAIMRRCFRLGVRSGGSGV